MAYTVWLSALCVRDKLFCGKYLGGKHIKLLMVLGIGVSIVQVVAFGLFGSSM